MEIEVLEKDDSSIKLRVKGGSQALLNLLKEKADSVSNVSFAGFTIEHPLEKSSIFVLRTSSGDAEKTFKKLVEKVSDDLADTKKTVLKLFK